MSKLTQCPSSDYRAELRSRQGWETLNLKLVIRSRLEVLDYKVSLVSSFSRNNWVLIGRRCGSVADVKSAEVVLMKLGNRPANRHFRLWNRQNLNVVWDRKHRFAVLLHALKMEPADWALLVVIVRVDSRDSELVMVFKLKVVDLIRSQVRWDVVVQRYPIFVWLLAFVSLFWRRHHVLNFEELDGKRTVSRWWNYRPLYHHRLIVKPRNVWLWNAWQVCYLKRFFLRKLSLRNSTKFQTYVLCFFAFHSAFCCCLLTLTCAEFPAGSAFPRHRFALGSPAATHLHWLLQLHSAQNTERCPHVSSPQIGW